MVGVVVTVLLLVDVEVDEVVAVFAVVLDELEVVDAVLVLVAALEDMLGSLRAVVSVSAWLVV